MTPSARRTPRQARSKDLVDRVVDAGARVLVEHGYAGASTNRIARAAGVSPGSLYQYFANKEAVVAAITARLIGEFANDMGPVLRETSSLPPADAVRGILDGALAALQRHTELLRALVDHVPMHQQREMLGAIRTRLSDRVHAALTADRELLRVPDVERTAWPIVEISQGLLVRYVLDAPPIEREDFLDDLAATMLRLAYRDGALA